MKWSLALSMLVACGTAPTDDERGSGSGGGPVAADDDAGESAPADDGADGNDAADDAGDATTSGGDGTTSADESTGEPGESETSDPPLRGDICPGDGSWEIRVTGENLPQHDGRKVWLSAVEPTDLGAEQAYPVVVRLEDTVEDGAFDLSCPTGLTQNDAYPSFALVIDADEDGTCSDDDLGFSLQLFGWNGPQYYGYDGPALYSHQSDPPSLYAQDALVRVGDLQQMWGIPFCPYYLPQSRR